MRVTAALGLAAFAVAAACGGFLRDKDRSESSPACSSSCPRTGCPERAGGCGSVVDGCGGGTGACGRCGCRFSLSSVALPDNYGVSDASMNERGTILASLYLGRPHERCLPERVLVYPDGSYQRFGSRFVSNLNSRDQLAGDSFVWTAGQYSWMQPLSPGGSLVVRDLDDRGIAVGNSGRRAVTWSDCVPTELPLVPGQWSAQADAIGGERLIAGQAHLGELDGDGTGATNSAVVWAPGGRVHVTHLDGKPVRVNRRNQVLIRSSKLGRKSCVFNLNGTVRDLEPLPGADLGVPAAVADLNDSGWVVGSSRGRAVLWREGQALDLNGLLLGGPPPEALTIAHAVDDSSRILVGTGGSELFLLTPGPGCLPHATEPVDPWRP